jgi:ribosome-associated translation inhibitor RaiA/cold shock CspA family protein
MIQVTFRDFPHSQPVEDHIQEVAERLNLFDRINHCKVVLTLTDKNKQQGKLYNVRINLAVPGKELVVTHQENIDLYAAIRDAFDAMTRQLEDYSRIRRGDVKTHELAQQGFVVRLFVNDGFGFIQSLDGAEEYYFNDVHMGQSSFTHLAVGDRVQFYPEPTNDGLQARRVTLERHNHAES